MTQTDAREIAADLRQGKGHYVRTDASDKYAHRVYRIKRTRSGDVSVYLGMDAGWTVITPGTTIYSDRDSYTA